MNQNSEENAPDARAQVGIDADHEVRRFLGDMQHEFPHCSPEEIRAAYTEARDAIAPSEAREELLTYMHTRLRTQAVETGPP